MERVETLLKKLQAQHANNASVAQLLLTVQMLEAELIHLHSNTANNNIVSINIPTHIPIQLDNQTTVIPDEIIEEKTVEILQIDESEIEAELEEIKHNAEMMKKISVQNKPPIVFEMEDDIPTLTHQQSKTTIDKKEINEIAVNGTSPISVNDKLKQAKIDLGVTLTDAPVRDLKKAIDINARFLFINELFRGDEATYERSIKTINGFSILPEAEYWIQRELKVKNGWNDNNEVVKQFYQLVKRRFS